MRLKDNYGRTINYLRLSVTDRCDMRCVYCMPADGIAKLEHDEVLSYEELLLLARAAVAVGIEKIRVTGGEPLVRKGLIAFLQQLAGIPGLRQLVLTTNGQLLAELAGDLKRAGVQRLNVSLDSLDPETFRSVTRCGDLERVLAGLRAAAEAELPVKLNMVVMRGVNDHEIERFAALTLEQNCSVRFIEYMPAIQERDWQSLVVSGEEILQRLQQRFAFTPVIRGELSGPAQEFKIAGARGNVGVITALSGHFCGDCNRIRTTSSGKVRTCLFSNTEIDLRPLLATGELESVKSGLLALIGHKPEKHTMDEVSAGHDPFSMANIGG